MSRIAALSVITCSALMAMALGASPVAAAATAPTSTAAAESAAQQVSAMLAATEGSEPEGANQVAAEVLLRTSAPAAEVGATVNLTASVLTGDGAPAAAGSTVAFQQATSSEDGLGVNWSTVGTAVVGDDGQASAQVVTPSIADTLELRAVSPAPAGDSIDGVVAAGTVVSPQLGIPVTSAAVPVATGVTVPVWPARGTVGSNEPIELVVGVTTTGGVPAGGVPVGFEYSADNGASWTSTGLPLRDLIDTKTGYPTLVPAVAPAAVTGADGFARATLVAPTMPGTVIFRAVAGVNATPSANSPAYGVVIDSNSLYNPPANSTSGVEQVNTMPSQPGVLIKAQKLDPNGANVVDRPLQYPAIAAGNPLAPGQPLVVPQVGGAGSPACFYRQDAREACVVGSTDGAGNPVSQGQWADQYRILYSDKRFLLNPPPYTDEASLGGELGTLEAASALVFVPKNATADSKVVAWTHPTIGQEPHCSVTRGFDTIPTVPGIDLTPMNGGAQINAGDMSFFLEQVLAAGHIVVMPDYMGIGVNGPTGEKKSYMIGQQEARDVFYGIKALRSAAAPGWSGVNGAPWTGTDFVVIGHSQGGHAAMWTGVESRKPWAQALGLNLKGVVAAAPASDIAKVVLEQWEGYGGWVLGPELIQTYAFQSPAFSAFAFGNNVLSPEGFENFPKFAEYCTTQAFAASVSLVNAGKNFLLNPAEHPQQFGNWAPVFAQQTPIITSGMQNSFPQDLPFQLISGTADNIVVSQVNAAMQQSFCLVDPESGQPTVPMRAYWLPSMTGLNTPPTSSFEGAIAGDVLTVTKLKSGRGSVYTKKAYGTPLPSGTEIPLNNVTNMRVGDQLVGWGADASNPTAAPAGTTVTAIDYDTFTVTLNNAVTPNNENLYFQPAFPGPLSTGTVLTWIVNTGTFISPVYEPRSATISARLTGGGGPGTYQLDSAPAEPTPVQNTTFEVQAAVAPPGGASPASSLQVPDHLNPLTFPFTQTEPADEVDGVVGYDVSGTGGIGQQYARTITLHFADALPPDFAVGERFSLSGLPLVKGKTSVGKDKDVDLNGIHTFTEIDAGAKTATFKTTGAPYPLQTGSTVAVSPPATASVSETHVNSAGELLRFTDTVFSGDVPDANCHEVDEAHPTGLDPSTTGNTWYNFPVFGIADLANAATLPSKESFYLSWGSAALPAPTETNPEPSLGLLFSRTLPSPLAAQSGCAFPWKPSTDFATRPTNPDCNQYGLWPYGEFTYATHDVDTGTWGVYPNEGQNTNIPAGQPPAPLPQGAVFTAIDPARVYDSRLPGAGGPVSAAEPRLIDLTAAGNLDLPEAATAVAYNITVTGQDGRGYATVTPGNVQVAPVTSTINWTGPMQNLANGYTVAIDDQDQIKVFVGETSGSTDVIIDVLGYYADGNDGSLFVPVNPQRAYATAEPIYGGENVVVDVVAGAPGTVPADATAIAYNLTIFGTTGRGFLALAPGSQATLPATSTINWTAAQTTIANATQGAVSDGRVKVFASGTGSTNFVLDVVGYYVEPGDVPPGAFGARFVGIDPTRAYDSRVDAPGGPLSGNVQAGGLGQPRTTSVATGGLVPAGARGVAYNLTITQTQGRGFLTTAPTPVPPTTSDINWTSSGTVLANGSLSGISEARQMTAWVGGRDNTQYLLDIAGYFK